MGIFRATTSFSFRDFTVEATTWLTISFRPYFQQAYYFVFNSIFPIMFRPGKTSSSSITAAGGSAAAKDQRPRSSASHSSGLSAPRQRNPKPESSWPRDAGGQ